MLIFHGSDILVSEPKILSSNRLLDFGEGFYTTSSLEQAKRWAKRVRERRNSRAEIITVYELDMAKAASELKIIRFDSPSPEWLRFVSSCRAGRETGYEYDMAIGPVANDNVYATIQLYEAGLLSEAETIIRLKIEKIFDQILFHTEKALLYCTYKEHNNAGGEAVG
jgi:hypothetical protein